MTVEIPLQFHLLHSGLPRVCPISSPTTPTNEPVTTTGHHLLVSCVSYTYQQQQQPDLSYLIRRNQARRISQLLLKRQRCRHVNCLLPLPQIHSIIISFAEERSHGRTIVTTLRALYARQSTNLYRDPVRYKNCLVMLLLRCNRWIINKRLTVNSRKQKATPSSTLCDSGGRVPLEFYF